MEIEVFAGLKDYFANRFRIDAELRDVAALKQYLVEMNPGAKAILNSCRFAVGNELVAEGYMLKGEDVVAILPPSSGG